MVKFFEKKPSPEKRSQRKNNNFDIQVQSIDKSIERKDE